MLLIAALGWAVLTLYFVSVTAISFTLLSGVEDALIGIGLIIAKKFLRTLLSSHRRSPYFSAIAYLLASAFLAYSYAYGEAWTEFLLGVVFTFIASAGLVIALWTRSDSRAELMGNPMPSK